jgi:hypothetical protein
MPDTHLPPVRDAEQRLAALNLSLVAREARAQIKHALKTGRIDPSAVLALGSRGVGDHICGRLQIRGVLRSLPGWGPVKTDRLLERLNIPPLVHLDQLTHAQVEALDLALADNLAQSQSRHRP